MKITKVLFVCMGNICRSPTAEAVFRHVVEQANVSDAILIDRGDLSRDIPLEKIPFAQEKILSEVKSTGTPVFIATNLMENMVENSQ